MPFEGIVYSPPQVMASKQASISDSKPAAVQLSTVFCADDADVVIRAAQTLDFRVHKCILSLASPVFKDMFTIPQPPTDNSQALPHVDVTESAETWEMILRTVYPMPTPVITTLDDLQPLLLAAKKYEMQFVIDSHEDRFRDRGFIQQDPLRLYAIACACGFEDWAKYVARNAESPAVTGRSDTRNLEGLTIPSYHRLVSFLAQRDKEWRETLVKTSRIDCDCDWRTPPPIGIGGDMGWPCLQTEVYYLRALERQSQFRQLPCKKAQCPKSDSGIKAFIERVVEERESLCNKLMRDTQYVQ